MPGRSTTPARSRCRRWSFVATPTRSSTLEDALGLFEKLGAEEKLFVTIGGGTHFISLEKRAPLLIAEVQAFLER